MPQVRWQTCILPVLGNNTTNILIDAVAKEAANDRTTGSTSYARSSARAPITDREVDDEEDDHRYEGEGIVDDDDDDY